MNMRMELPVEQHSFSAAAEWPGLDVPRVVRDLELSRRRRRAPRCRTRRPALRSSIRMSEPLAQRAKVSTFRTLAFGAKLRTGPKGSHPWQEIGPGWSIGKR